MALECGNCFIWSQPAIPPSPKGSRIQLSGALGLKTKSMSSITDTTIAIVDDEEGLCRSMCRLLRAAGYRPVAFSSAEEFLLSPDLKSFGCLVLDIQLGGMSGLELHQKLLMSGVCTPVIFITAHDAVEVQEQAQAAGCIGYFRKTDSGEGVLDAINRAVQIYLLSNYRR